ncbi:MFS transporter [Salinispora arenicola]|uniref:MFS transporter n=2 Tax=Salinispora arenicola TaxID=168697 RepID=UPI000370E943
MRRKATLTALPRWRRWSMVGVGQLVVFLGVATGAMLVIAVPEIVNTFAANEDDQQWLVAGFSLAYGLVQVPSGRLGDLWGHREVLVGGLVLYGLAGVTASLAMSSLWLVIAVLVLGGALGAVIPQVYGLSQQLFSYEERGFTYGLLGVAVAVGIGSGPIMGGLLVDTSPALGWRLVFLAAGIFGVLAAALGYWLVPTTGSRGSGRISWRKADPVGIVLLGVGVTALWLPMVEDHTLRSFDRWVSATVGVSFLVGFVFWDRQRARRGLALFYLGLLRIRSYGFGVLITLLFGAYDSLFYVLAVYLQEGVGHEPLTAGIVMAPAALGAAAGALIGGRMVKRAGWRTVAIGLLVALSGLIVVVVADIFLPTLDSPHSAAMPLLVAGLGAGLVISGTGSSLTFIPSETLTLSKVPTEQAGSAAGMLTTAHRFGLSAGTVIVSTALFATLRRTGDDWLAAFRVALLIIAGFTFLALVANFANLWKGKP